MTNQQIDVMIYSFKNKKLKDNVISIINNSKLNNFEISIIDQNPVNRESIFNEFKSVRSYLNVFWDSIKSPTVYKNMHICDSESEYVLLISGDVELKDGWDVKLIELLGDQNIIISGQGIPELSQKDLYFLTETRAESSELSLTNFIDNNFIFGRKDILMNIEYPKNIKYFGENEIVSCSFYCSGIDIYSLPTGFYNDLKIRHLETYYTVMSLEHNYNFAVDILNGETNKYTRQFPTKRNISMFLKFHNLKLDTLKRLPFQKNDVEYDPDGIKFLRSTPQRFVDTTKVIS